VAAEVAARPGPAALVAFWQRHRGEGVVVIGIDAHDFKSDARRFVERNKVTYSIAFDGPGSTLGHHGISQLPETWFVDKEGRLVGERVEGPVTKDILERNMHAALGRGS
jgi:cytochrome c biogenesis protein CcmG, thiol:disulfide interchange protein DsbE